MENVIEEYNIPAGSTYSYTVMNNTTTHTVTVKKFNSNQVVVSIPYERIWVGDRDFDENVVGPESMEYGNALLLKLSEETDKYVYIGGKRIIIFKGGNIHTFYSQDNMGRIYSYACDDELVYFFQIKTGVVTFPRNVITEIDIDYGSPDNYYQKIQYLDEEQKQLIQPIPSQDYITYLKQKNILRKAGNVNKVPMVGNIRGIPIPNNIEATIGSFLSGKPGTLLQQREALQTNYNILEGGRKGRRTRKGGKKVRRTHKKRNSRK